MNKKLLAAAVAAAVVAAPAAFAESTVYGKFHVSIDNNDIDDTKDNYEVNSRSSRLGFKGSEDLGGGLKATYQLELSVDVTDGSGVTGTNRNTYIGLAGDFGEFRVGRHDTPAKTAFYGSGNDVLGDSILDLNPGSLNPIGVFTERRVNNAIAYISPNFSGFQVAAAIIPGEESGISQTSTTPGSSSSTSLVATSPANSTTTVVTNASVLSVYNPGTSSSTTTTKNDNDGLADHYSVGAWYSGNGLKAGLGYEKLSGSNGADDDKMWQAGASYAFDMFQIGAQYEDRELANGDWTAYAVSGKATFGNNAITAVYTNGEYDADSGSSSDYDTDGWGLGAEHNFSKRTKAYVAYAAGTKDPDSGKSVDDDRFSLGMIHNF